MFAKQLSCFKECLLSSNLTTQFLSASPLVTSSHSSYLF